jgi:hypothetical protein
VVNATTRRQHPNAPLTVEGRRRMVRWVTDRGWNVESLGFLIEWKMMEYRRNPQFTAAQRTRSTTPRIRSASPTCTNDPQRKRENEGRRTR